MVLHVSRRFVPATVLAVALSACSGWGAGVAPQHGVESAGKTTQATFTIRWTNAAASASVRRRDTISPSAQSIAVLINGTPGALANRGPNPTQTIPLIAPVGNDQFIFNVYDGLNGQGKLLGSATVQQLIVDGAANSVTASIQAVCSVTNVAYANDDPLVKATYGPSGTIASTLQSIVLAGQLPATLIVEPEDVDGNVIIEGTGGTVPATITGSATVAPVDGAHIKLTPLSGSRSTTPDTLTVSAPTCPSTTVAVQHSPAIYVENTSNDVSVYDWYGDEVASGQLAAGDVLIGYDTHSGSMIAYNPGSGQVNEYPVNLTSHMPLYSIYTGMTAAWSSNARAVFAAQPYAGPAYHLLIFSPPSSPYEFGSSTTSPTVAIASSTFSNAANGYFAFQGYLDWLSFAPDSVLDVVFPSTLPVSLAADDHNKSLYAFNPTTPYVSQYSESLGGPTSGNSCFGSAPMVGAVDTDGDNLYAVLSNTALAACSTGPGNPALSGFGTSFGTGVAIVILSTNEQ